MDEKKKVELLAEIEIDELQEEIEHAEDAHEFYAEQDNHPPAVLSTISNLHSVK